jgi:hypothetical protein
MVPLVAMTPPGPGNILIHGYDYYAIPALVAFVFPAAGKSHRCTTINVPGWVDAPLYVAAIGERIGRHDIELKLALHRSLHSVKL